MKTVVALLAAALLCRGQARAGDPLLVIDAGGHNATVRSALFTADSRYLVSAGEDKVVRVWDIQTGQTVRALRGEIGAGPLGKIYAAALSPGDRYLAVAGFLTGNAIRIYDFHSGEVKGLLSGHRGTVECLAFSPDGAYLASGDAAAGIRLWDAAGMKLARELSGHAGRVHSVAFSRDGTRLVSAGADSAALVWDVRAGAPLRRLPGHRGFVVSAAFSPDNRVVASVSDDRSVRYWDANTGSLIKEAENAVSHPANAVFSPDGSRLLTTSALNGTYSAALLSVPGGAPGAGFGSNDSTITATAISPDGKMAATAGGARNDIYVWSLSTGQTIRRLVGKGQPVRSVGFASDGRSIAFGNEPSSHAAPNAYGNLAKVLWLNQNGDDYRVDVGWELPPGSTYVPARETLGDRALRLAVNASGQTDAATLQLVQNGATAGEFHRDQSSGYRHLCFTLAPGGRIVSGALNGFLTLYANNAQPRSFVGHTGNVWAVAVSPDGRTLVSGSDDQTVRLWDMDTQENLLTVFVASDREWVASTPQGYYDSSFHGDQYVGWHLNQGEDKAAKYWVAARFQKEFYRGDVVSQHLQRHNLQFALRAANLLRGKPERPQAAIVSSLPPIVYIADPNQDEIVVQSASYKLKGVALSNTLPISEIVVLVNDAPVETLKPNSMRREFEVDISLRKGPNTVKVAARNENASGEMQRRTITSTDAPPAAKPNLYVLAIGISQYRQQSIALKFGDNDARKVAALFQAQAHGPLFDNVIAKVLPNEQATRANIIRSLSELSAEGAATDVRLLFLAGHGELGGARNDQYFFCSYEHTPEDDPEQNDVRWDVLLEKLTAMKGKAILMVDTCHAAAVSGGAQERGVKPVDFTRVLKEFSQNPGLVIFSASRGVELSIEDPAWQHGAFTQALIEGLGGKALKERPMIRTSDLEEWLNQRVPQLNPKQHPIVSKKPDDLLPFPVFAIP